MKHLRKRFFVDRTFQGGLLVRLVAYWAIYHVTLWHLMFLFTIIGTALDYDPTAQSTPLAIRYCRFFRDHTGIIICSGVMLPIVARDLLKFSHRLAGPLIRFRSTMQAMVDGKPVQEVRLRKGDMPSEFLTVFNNLIRVWNERSGTPQQSNEKPEFESARSNKLELTETESMLVESVA